MVDIHCRRRITSVVRISPKVVLSHLQIFLLSEFNISAITFWLLLEWQFCNIAWSTLRNTKNSGPRVYYDDDDVSEILYSSEESEEDDWEKEGRRKRLRNAKVRGSAAKKQQSEEVRIRKGNNSDGCNDFGGVYSSRGATSSRV
ncbi:hypothetical protein SLE2022_120970 [Rubroshorea leprosula]